MKIMLIEDDEKKYQEIASHLKENRILETDIIRACNMTDFAANLSADIGLFIIDLKLPCLNDGKATQNGREILETIIKAGKQDALLLAISSYPSDFPDLRSFYEANGCILADFANKEGWKSSLNHLLIQLNKNMKLDFVIFCALQKERNPYVGFSAGNQVTRRGIVCYDIKLGGRDGTIVLLPKMGLVNAAVTAGVCIDRFRPSVVGMSGICGGIKNRADVGQLFVSSMAYEYQSGKWTPNGFQQEPYQVQTDHMTLTELQVLANTDGLISELEEGFSDGKRPPKNYKPLLGIFTSGSAVIGNDDYMKQIEIAHRKVNALDMEVFAIQRAAELSPNKPPCICAKTVVDLCDDNKEDDLHSYGSYISAKFLIKAINHFFKVNP